MFSDGREQKGFKSPHFIPWLRNSLKAHHSSGDLGLNGPFRSGSEARNHVTPLEKAKGISFFSIPEKGRPQKGELRCNGMGVLRGHHVPPGKQTEDNPGKLSQTKERDPKAAPSPGGGPRGLQDAARDRRRAVGKHSSQLSPHSVWKYGPLVGPPLVGPSLVGPPLVGPPLTGPPLTGTPLVGPPLVGPPLVGPPLIGPPLVGPPLVGPPLVGPPLVGPPLTGPPPTPVSEESNCSVPVALCMDERTGELLDRSSRATFRHRDRLSSIWLNSDTQGLTERQQGFSSTCSSIHKHSRNQDRLDLREPPVEGFREPANGLVFSAECPSRTFGSTATLRGPRKARANPQAAASTDQNQTWAWHRPNTEAVSERREAGCRGKVVRNQIQRVVDNLEKVLTALRDVQDEMKEVVQQIDSLTSSIDLNEEQQGCGGEPRPPSDSSSASSSTHRRSADAGQQRGAAGPCGAVRREHPGRSQSPLNLQTGRTAAGFLSESSRTLRLASNPLFSPKKAGLKNFSTLSSSNQLPNLNFSDHTPSPQRSLPGRPPTPGLSPITVSLHRPPSPASQPPSPGVSSSIKTNRASPPSQPCPPPALSPSVIIETNVRPYQTSQSDPPSAAALTPSPTHPQSASCPPTDSDIQPVPLAEQRASSAGPSHLCPEKPPTAQGRGGRKPPPYPHHRLTKKGKEPRRAPPYPEKRRLLSTTV